MAETGAFWRLYEELKAGRLSRREFIRRATALGVTLPVVLFVLQATKLGGPVALAQDAASGRPSIGTENQQRGAGGELKLLQWQAPTHASIHTSTGAKDSLAAALVTEPLLSFLPDATLVPTLVKEVPSEENGLLAPDRMSVTYNLLEGVKWNDGEPFTARDVVFTHQWIMDPANASVSTTTYEVIDNIEAIDDLTVKINFTSPQPAWYLPFSSTWGGAVYPGHLWDFESTKEGVIDTFRQAPVGTGPYKVESFSENDQAIYVINEHYREPNKPFFERVNLKGGGDPASAALAVLQTGDWHLAWNTQVEPAVLAEMEQAGKGKVVVVPGLYVERISFNFSDPDTEVDGQRSQWQTPHPILADKAVRQAMTLGADRQTVADELYFGDRGEPPAANILIGPPRFASPNTSWEFNVEQAKQILDEAGWVLDGDVRKKDDVELSVDYATTINSVRQKTQAVVKQGWEEIGIKVQLKQIDAGIFFDSAAGNEQNLQHFYTDLQMYANSPGDPYPISYMAGWYSNNGENIAQKADGWSKDNSQRYNNPEYDQLFEQLRAEVDPEAAAELFIQLNDILINDYVIIPLVNRSATTYAILNEVRDENLAPGQFESLYWNIANWNLAG